MHGVQFWSHVLLVFFPGKWICLSHLYYMMEMGGPKPKRPAPRIWSRYHARHGRGSNPNSFFFFRIVDGYIVIVLLFQRYTCYILLYCCTMRGIVGTYHVYIIVDSMNVVLYILILRDGISLFHTYIYIYSCIYIYIYSYIYILIYSIIYI
jgi:hypothetical protein